MEGDELMNKTQNVGLPYIQESVEWKGGLLLVGGNHERDVRTVRHVDSDGVTRNLNWPGSNLRHVSVEEGEALILENTDGDRFAWDSDTGRWERMA